MNLRFAIRLLSLTLALAGTPAFAALPQVFNPNGTIFVRPGGTSFTWTYGTGTTPAPGFPGTYAVTQVSYHNVDFAAPTADYLLTRGHFETSTDGTNWTTYTHAPFGEVNFVPVAGKIWRFVNTTPADTTTTQNVGFAWFLQGVPNNVGSGSSVVPDNAPTNITANKSAIFSNAAQNDTLATLTPTDTGLGINGYWVIESQSTANLFTLSFDRTTGNTAKLRKGTGTMPAVGQTVTVTARYYDQYQTDSSGNPIGGQGFAKTFTFTVVSDVSNELTFGNDVAVNTYTTEDQSLPALARLTTGNVVAVWQSRGQNKSDSNTGVFGQLLSSAGAKVGSELSISSASTTTSENNPSVAALASGRYVVAYSYYVTSTFDQDIAFRIVEANGTVGTQKIANTTTVDWQYSPSVATLTDGSFVIVWSDDDGKIRLRQFNASDGSAVAGEVEISGSGTSPDVAGLSNGGYVVTYLKSDDVKVKVNGGSEVAVGIPSGTPRVAALSGGGFVVTSTNYDYDNETSRIEAARYNDSAVLQGSKFTVNTATGNYRVNADVAALTGGGFVIVWQSAEGDFDYNGLFGRRFTSTGTAVDAADVEFNQGRRGDQYYPALAPLANDAFAVAWTDYSVATIESGDYFGEIKARFLGPSNTAPTFVGATTTLAVNQNASATDIKGLLHASDSDASQTLTWTVTTAPGHGTLSSFSAATASSGSTDITPGGTLTYTPTASYFGSDSFTIQVSDGTATASRTISVTVSDVTAPTVVSVVRLSPTGQAIAAGPVVFRVTYSEAVTNVTTAQFAFEAASGNVTGSVTDVTGTGTTRDVTVTISGGAGEFRLKVVN